MMAVDRDSPASVVKLFGKLYLVTKENGGTFDEFFQRVIDEKLPSIVDDTLPVWNFIYNLRQTISTSRHLHGLVTSYYYFAGTAFHFVDAVTNMYGAIEEGVTNPNDVEAVRRAQAWAVELYNVLYIINDDAPPGLVTRWD
jgi:hypothetical protein